VIITSIVSFDLHSKSDTSQAGTGSLGMWWGQLCLIQLHQGTKVKAHQPTAPVHNTVCGSLYKNSAPN